MEANVVVDSVLEAVKAGKAAEVLLEAAADVPRGWRRLAATHPHNEIHHRGSNIK